MNARVLTDLLLAASLAACAMSEPVVPVVAAAVVVALPTTAFAKPAYRAPAHARIARRAPRTPVLTPLQALAAANGAARQRPRSSGFVAARHVYVYAPGALYELYTNPSFVSTILLEPGETLNDIAAGDTARWMVTETTAETETDGRTVVLVKPQANALRTNIVLITDRRTYLIEAISQTGEAYSAQVAWSYPDDGPAATASASVDRLNFDYRVHAVRGPTPRWTPTRVFDDGRRTWIEFSPDIVAADMPPLFVITPEGAELVNYRVQGTRYVVDRVFDVAELRLGTRKPVVVRMERHVRRMPASPTSPTAPRGAGP